MLRLLLFLSVLVLLPHAHLAQFMDLTACPINYFGKMFTQVYFAADGGKIGICFDGLFSLTDSVPTQKECVLGEFTASGIPEVLIKTADAPDFSEVEKMYHDAVPAVTAALVCEVTVTLGVVSVKYASFGTETVLLTESSFLPVQFQLYVNGEPRPEFTFGPTTVPSVYTDLSGCRDDSGAVHERGADLSELNLDTCEKKVCSENAETIAVGCPGKQRCQGGGMCDHDNQCTVTANAVLPFNVEMHDVIKVMDRCKYTLMEVQNFKALAIFQDHYYTRPSVFETLKIFDESSGSLLKMTQSGDVMMDDEMLTFTDGQLELQGLVLTKDEYRITGEWTNNDFSVYFCFNGISAQFTFKGPVEIKDTMGGLCAGESLESTKTVLDGMSEQVNSSDPVLCFTPSCEEMLPEPMMPMIDCSAVTEYCNILTTEPFSICNEEIDPAPFIEACTNFLCHHSGRDGYRCQFPYVYAHTCGQHDILVDWMTPTGCPEYKGFCGDRICLDHEYCGITENNEKGCFCRGHFGQMYRRDGTYGDDMECAADGASFTLIGCLVEEKGFDPSELHLIDPNCKGVGDTMSHTWTFHVNTDNTCGTEVENTHSHVLLTNMITDLVGMPEIVRRDHVTIDISCSFPQPGILKTRLRLLDNSVVQQFTTGEVTYNTYMDAFLDGDLTEPLTESSYTELGQTIWVNIRTEGLNEDVMSVVADSCWVTDEDNLDGGRIYYLINAGCPADETVKTYHFGEGLSNKFSFEMLQFTGNAGDISLFCNVQLCVHGGGCAPDCRSGARRRRSTKENYINQEPALISMTWTH